MGDSPAFALVDASKSFGATEAVDRLSLEVAAGEIYALLGPNGAGKTTALALLTGLRRPDRGLARVFGRDPREPAARASIGVTPQTTGFPATLRVFELVELVRAHHAKPLPLTVVLDEFGLADVARRQAGGLSGGQQRRLALALAFAGDPPAVVLDEPTTGLDVESRRDLWARLRRYAEGGGSVLMTTHYLEEAEALASRIGILLGGRKVAEGDVAAIRAAAGVATIRLDAVPDADVPGVLRVVHNGRGVVLHVRDAPAVVIGLVHAGVSLDGLEVRAARLEDAFSHLTAR